MTPLPIARAAPTTLGSYIQSRYLGMSISHRQFALLIKVHRNSLPKLFTNQLNMTIKQLDSIAEGLGVPRALLYAYLLVGGENGHRPSPQKIAGTQRKLTRLAQEIRQARVC